MEEEVVFVKTNNNLKEEILQINKKLDYILEILAKQNQTCKKLDNHVEFVESTYNSVRELLNYIYNKVNNIMGNSEKKSLPMIEQNKE